MKRMNAAAIRNKSGLDAAMNAVIIYGKPHFAAEANAMLEGTAHQTDQTTHWSVKLWRVDMLKLSPLGGRVAGGSSGSPRERVRGDPGSVPQAQAMINDALSRMPAHEPLAHLNQN